MTVRVSSAGTIELTGICSSDEGEVLLQNLLTNPTIMVDWRGCEEAHTTVIQVLMASKAKLLGPPAGGILVQWVQPLLAANMRK